MFDSDIQNPTPSDALLSSDEEEERGGLWSALGRFLRETFYTLFLTAALYIALNAVTARIRVEGYSMVPTLRGGEFILVNRLAYRFGRLPQRGDIIVFRPENNGLGDYIKRVVGLPGDEILVQNGTVFVNNQPLYEPYVLEKPFYSGYWKVPEGHIFVLGDNRNHSTDSHILGPIPLERVIGQAVLVYWPPSRVRWLLPRAPEAPRLGTAHAQPSSTP
ncbi:MAG: signal peptidase I [Chloroflexi bacterium]|nr:signal peptidase I [Chloroflexota bacterium]